jgi:hypothetical protein
MFRSECSRREHVVELALQARYRDLDGVVPRRRGAARNMLRTEFGWGLMPL